MILMTFLFILGFVFLVKGADYLIDGSTVLAKRFHVSNIVIGLTIVSIGTSAPELVVNIISGIKGYGEIALGNIFGSNIANIILVLGIGAMMRTLVVHYKKVRVDLLVLLGAIGALFLAAMNCHQIIWQEGLLLLLFFIAYLFFTFKQRKEIYKEKIHARQLWLATIMFFIGILMLYFGGRWVVEGVVVYAKIFSISQGLIALTVVALGTSLPELAVTIISIMKNNYEIAVGNAIGSNIFNILWVIGFGSLLAPINFDPKFYLEFVILLATTLLLLIFLKWRGKLTRGQGVLFLIAYFSYLVYIFYRN